MQNRVSILAGEPQALSADLPIALAAAGYTVGTAYPASVLINLDATGEPDAIVARCEDFVAQIEAGATIVSLLQGGFDWPAARRMACMSAFTRQAARDWAARRIRVNALALGTNGPAGWNAAAHDSGSVGALPATPKDVSRVVMAILAFPSMTGQIIRLGS